MVCAAAAPQPRRTGAMWRLAAGLLVALLAASPPTIGVCVRGASVPAVDGDAPYARPCGDQICSGNATCLLTANSDKPVCLGRTKPGTCPFTQRADCDKIKLICAEDTDCLGQKICCQDGCSRVCVDRGEDIPKPGHCPARFTFGPCTQECSEDGECSGTNKCCSTGCGFICSTPYLSKPGSCPAPIKSGASCAVECTLDDECPAQQKCCSNGCGRQCLGPSEEPICPKGTSFLNKCNNCTCSHEHEPVQCEDNICTKEKPGFCPDNSLHRLLRSQGCGPRCYGDDNCPGDTKCCDVSGCGPICAPIADDKPGICPVAEGHDRCGEFCATDADCDGGAKCCKTGCGKTCKPPDEPGFCPSESSSAQCFFKTNECLTSSDCGSGHKCCDSPCGRKCAQAVAQKPGLCPNPHQLILDEGIFCKNDHQCSKDQKCCRNGKGDMGCNQPTEYKTTCRNVQCTKRGYYCVDTNTGPECINKPKTTCADTVCEDNASCLQRHDKAICVPHTKVGKCPLNTVPLTPCREAHVMCETDDQCQGEDICCTSGCVRKCVTPQKTDCATIGKRLCRTAGYICKDTPDGAICVEDLYTCEHKRCPVGYICHDQFNAGARCIRERETCATKICAPGEDCYEEEDGAICVQTYVSEASIKRGYKPGKCPAIKPGVYRGDCQDECKFDSECDKAKRCCNNGCARVCIEPDFRKTCDELTCSDGHVCLEQDKLKDAFCINTATKDGRCPAHSFWTAETRSCQDQCQYDFQCDGAERCCGNGCASVCVPPDLRKRCEDHQCEQGYACVDDGVTDASCVSTAPSAGRCPAIEAGSLFCSSGADDCTYDSQCPDGDKCCGSPACAKQCVPADTRRLCVDINCPEDYECIESAADDARCFFTGEKDGLCPKVTSDVFPRGGCIDVCRLDSQCDGDSKCCHNGCANVCLRPREPDCDSIKCRVGFKCSEDRFGQPICSAIPCRQDGDIIDIECNSCTCIQGFLLCSQEECPPIKPGFCPRLTKGYRGRCVEECVTDYDCRDKTKCCSTGCGHTCQDAVPEIVHPCRTVRFRCGNETTCAATRGLCQPGKTCPLSSLCVGRTIDFCQSCPPGKVCVLQKQSCPLGRCQRQPICIQLYSDDTIFEEDEDLELAVIAKQNPNKFF